MKPFFRAFLPALLFLTTGCGGAEPTLRDMTDEERAQQAEKQRAYQEEQMKAAMGAQQQNNQYRNAAREGGS